MQLILTGASVPAHDMERYGIVTEVVSADSDVVEEAIKLAASIAAFSVPVVGLAKQAVKAGEYICVRVLGERSLLTIGSRNNNAAPGPRA